MYKIVIIDDNPMLRRSLSETIDWEGISCRVEGLADNGASGWTLINSVIPDVVISDIKMPGLSGIDLIERIAGSSIQTQVIFITGFQEFEYAQKAIKYGASDLLLKPIKNSELICSVQKALKKKRSAPAPQETLDTLSEMRMVGLQICLLVERSVNGDALTESSKIINELNGCQSIMEITEYMDTALKRLKRHNIQEEVSPLAKSILDHISQHYCEEITLSQVAQKFFLNPSYLSRLLKKETNHNFTDIISSIRIDNAKKLLQDPSLKIIDIAQMSGFSDYAYFSLVFKKLTGLSPSEFRKSCDGRSS